MPRRLSVLAVLLSAVASLVLTAVPASATTSQVTVLPPQDGQVSSAPDEAVPHPRSYGGDYSFDVTGSGPAYARFRNPTAGLSLTVAAIGRACRWQSFADGGDRVDLNVLLGGAKVGLITYAHLTRFVYAVGASVPVGARIADVVTASDGVVARPENGCWSGPHIHVEPRNDVKYGCFVGGLFGKNVNGDSALGILGGERAGAVNTPCPAGFETGGGTTPPPGASAQTGADGANLRADATTASAVVASIPPRTTLPLTCWKRGQAVTSSTGTYTLWHGTSYGSANGYVSDTVLNTPAFPDPAADQPAAGEPACSTPAPPVTPSIGVSPSSGDHSTLFQGTASGFTPGSTASLVVHQPDGSPYAAAYTKTRAVDGSGNFAWTWRWDPGDQDGGYRFVFSDSTGPTAETRLTITAPVMPSSSPSASPSPSPSTMPPPGSVLGFDAASAPALSTMQAWRADSPYRAVGVYIPVRAPESDDRYDKVQANLTPAWVSSVGELGYTVVPIYFGKQAPLSCSSTTWWNMAPDVATARQQGLAAAADAAGSADALGLPRTTPVVYDLEPFRAGCEAAISAFLGAWTEALHGAGRLSSVYGSQASTTRLLRTASTRPVPAPDSVWAATADGSGTTSSLAADYSPWAGRLGNQYALDVTETHGGVTVKIDRSAWDAGALSATPPGGPTSGPSPSLSPAPSPSPSSPAPSPSSGPASGGPVTVSLDRAVIAAGERVTATYRGTPGTAVEVLARTQPATTYSVIARVVLDASGSATTSHAPQRNTRITAQPAGGAVSSTQPLVSVTSLASFNAVRTATRTYALSGRVYPALQGRLVSIYRDGRLTAQVRCDAQGIYRITRTLGAGTSTFQARTPTDTYNVGTTTRQVRFTVR